MPLVDYRAKYMDLKTKYMETCDLSWRLGYEQGLRDAQLDQAAQQQAQADQMAMAANGQPQAGQSGEEGAPGEEQEQPGQPQSQNPNGDELDSHIARLESMLGKGELVSADLGDLKKTLSDIRSLQVQINLTKSMASIKNTRMAPLKKSQVLSPRVQANLPEPAKKALSLQENIVKNVFDKWAKDESQATSEIGSILNVDGIVKKS
jgi:hypothetical protein